MALLAILGSLLLAIWLIQTKGGDSVLFGGQERPNRIVGGQVQLRAVEMPGGAEVDDRLGHVVAFDESAGTYRVELATPLETAAGPLKSVEIRSVKIGHAFSSVSEWSKYGLAVELRLGPAGTARASADLYRYPRSAVLRRLALPAGCIAAGLAALVHGGVSAYAVHRLEIAGKSVAAHVANTRVSIKRDVKTYEVCYEVFDERSGKFYGPDWFATGAACTAASAGQYDDAVQNKYITVFSDPENPRFNSLSSVSLADTTHDLVIALTGLGALGYGCFRARR